MDISRIALVLARLPILLLLAAGLMFAPAARADTTNCTAINTVPVKLASPGHYCLGHNVTVASAVCCGAPAIQVAAANVTVDCNGYSVNNANATDSRNGILSTFDDVTIRNCTLNDFARGIVVQGGKRVRLQDNAIVRARVLGITATVAQGFLIDNRVIDTAGCQAIYAFAAARSVIAVNGNVIRNVSCTTGTPTGIVATGNGRLFVGDNRIEGLGVAGVSAQSFGVLISTGASVSVPALVDDNHFYLMNSTNPISIVKTSTAQKGRCSGNVAPGTTKANTGCL